jgi:hypothetical protein
MQIKQNTMTDSTVSMAGLYPVIHDLTEVEYRGHRQQQQHLNQQDNDNDQMCGHFYLRDLALPLSNPLNFHTSNNRVSLTEPPTRQTMNAPSKENPRRRSSFLRRICTSIEFTSTELGDTPSSSLEMEENVKFEDKYQLQRQVCMRMCSIIKQIGICICS